MATREMSVQDEKKRRKKEKAKAAVKIPTKRTMNFVHHKQVFNPRRMIPLILALVLFTGLFVKFGILDPLEKKSQAYEALAVKQDQLISLQNMLSDYKEVEIQYGRYSEVWMSDSEVGLVNRIEVLNLVEKYIDPSAVIEDLAINGNVLTLNVHGITLEQASTVVEKLEATDLVEKAAVYTANAEYAEEADMFLSIILTKEVEADEKV